VTAPARAGSGGKGVVVVKLKTPDGVPGVVALKKADMRRLVTKEPVGTIAKVKLSVPVGRWAVSPQRVVHDSAIFIGSPSAKRVRVRAGEKTPVTVTYSAAPSVTDLRVTRVDRFGLDLSWESPSADAEYAVRMAVGSLAPSSVTSGTSVPTTGTAATVNDLSASTQYAFSVFARRPGTTKWWGPVSTTVTTPSSDPFGETAVAVTNPATVMVTDPTTVDVSVANGKVRTTLPSGTTPTVGQPWVLPPSDALPGGFIGLVSQVSADGRSVVLVAGGLADAFDYLDIRVPDLSDVPTTTLARPAPTKRLDGTAVGVQCTGSLADQVVVDPDFDPFGHFNATLTKYDIFGKDVPVGMSFDTRFGVDVVVSADVKVTAGADCQLDLPPIVATIPAGPVPIVVQTEPILSVGVFGEVSMQNLGFTASVGASVEGYLGLGGDDHVDGDLIASASPLDPTIDKVDAGLRLTAGVQTSVGPGLGNPEAGAMVGLSATLNALDANATPAGGLGCLELSAESSASISLEAKAWLGSWDFSRSVTVPGLEQSVPYVGSPWHLPDGCGGNDEYRISDGTLDVTHSWSGGCSGDQGACDDGPDYTSSMTFNESSSAHLKVAEPGPWTQQWDAWPAYLDAPMYFTSWDFDSAARWQGSGYGCSWRNDYETVGPMQFASAYWATGATAMPGPELSLDAHLTDYYNYEQWSDQWTPGWWGSFGAWDTDFSNGYPRITTRSSWSNGGDCEGSGQDEYDQPMEYLAPGFWWVYPEEARRSSTQVSSTPLDGCTPEACSWRVEGTDTYEFRSDYADYGYQGSGTATVHWSYVVERRRPPTDGSG
jgi:hypothetical protein